ncbi:APOPT family protein CG14806, mitochondrial [Scaptodrosophila lebanonensis]|uniref:APOPT family protein CG14806, mitochondrial n=1 Tax=Drosophila lebanonensis TaxID=7225 RepID=A0A6J2TSD4_DROLE|nr:APOPT family protein CG14806, mitochondrial [Scaptodrosophila lebanonensis]
MYKCTTHRTFGQLQLWPRWYAKAVENEPKKSQTVGLAQRPDPESVGCDYIGPPDPDSNLRPYVRHYNNRETPLAKKLRLRRIEIDAWNNDFWTKHNKRFYQEKEDFIQLHKNAGTASQDITADSMSVFYKSFLDKNRRMHIMYNISWYLKNVELLVLAFQVFLQKLLRREKKPTQ